LKQFGLIGKSLGHSFSQTYFQEKFQNEGLKDYDYQLFEIPHISTFQEVIKLFPKLCGLNVTIPYKTEVMRYLDLLDEKAKIIGAVNTIEFLPNGKLKGWNTDYIGFRTSILPLLKPQHEKALVFGSGGASKAVQAVLNDLGIDFLVVSRDGGPGYEDVDAELLQSHKLLINCTPLGTLPNTAHCVDIPYEALTPSHLLFDLVYNPEETLFMAKGKEQGATVKNGLEMLHKQAEAAWEIWNSTE
jgi:shikimate dehydrogenase